jgi:hypothetical protein
MRWRKDLHRHISVSFLDADTGASIAQSQVPVEDLPASFATRTTVSLGGADWTVERAEPADSARFQTSGKLSLWLRRVQWMDPAKILVSLPTLADELPPTGASGLRPSDPVLELHEDDWRQIEFVARHHAPAIERACAAVRRIHAEERQGGGFRRLHIRKEIPQPIAGSQVRLAEITALVPTGAPSPRALALGAPPDSCWEDLPFH